MARRATRFLAEAGPGELLLADLVLAEVVYVLQSVYSLDRPDTAAAARAIVTFWAIQTNDQDLLLRALEVCDVDRLDFAEASLVAAADDPGSGPIVSFDKSIRRVPSASLIEP